MFYATGLTGWQRAAMGVPGGLAGFAAGPPAMSAEQELQMLRQQADAAAATLESVRQRIDEIAAARARPQTPEQAGQPSQPQ
jgi:hypothetical protein